MKRLSLILFATISMIYFISCDKEKEITSLEGTTWIQRVEDDGGWLEYKLSFTSTHATYALSSNGEYTRGFTETYVYDSPTVTIEGSDSRASSIGTVKGKTLRIELAETLDWVEVLELKKQ